MFSGLLQKDLFKGGCSSAEMFFQKNYCHVCHTRFAVFFPLPSCCVSSLLIHRTCSDIFVELTDRLFMLYTLKIQQGGPHSGADLG